MKILSCILNHNENDKAVRWKDSLNCVTDCIIIDSGSSVIPSGAISFDNIYYGGCVNASLDAAIRDKYDWVIMITPDVVIDDIGLLYESIKNNCIESVGVWAPSVKQGSMDYWNNFNNGTHCNCKTRMINGFFLAVNSELFCDWKRYISGCKYGYVCDVACTYLSEKYNKNTIIDNSVQLYHPHGTSYSSSCAMEEELHIYEKYPELKLYKESICLNEQNKK